MPRTGWVNVEPHKSGIMTNSDHKLAETSLLNTVQQKLLSLEYDHSLLQQQHDALLQTLSHDLRTPAMTILGFTDLLMTDLSNNPDLNALGQYLEYIRNSAQRQVRLISALTEYGNLSRQAINPATLDLTALIMECLQSRPDKDELTNTRFDFQPTPVTTADTALLKTALNALLDNAIKFTLRVDRPIITFGYTTVDGQPSYFLNDNGTGFNTENQERLFKPFSRFHSGKDYDGDGMGLATASLIVQKHHGRIWVESNQQQGTTLCFTLGA